MSISTAFSPNNGVVVPIPFNAANFGAGGGGSWTVISTDVHTAAYWKLGAFIHVDLDMNAGTVAGNPPFLTFTLPFTVIRDGVGMCVVTPATNPTPAFVNCVAGSATVQLFRMSGNWTNGVTPLSFEVSLIQI